MSGLNGLSNPWKSFSTFYKGVFLRCCHVSCVQSTKHYLRAKTPNAHIHVDSDKKVEAYKDGPSEWAFFLFPYGQTRENHLMLAQVVYSTSWAHVLPSSFIQQVPPFAAPWAWILLIDSTNFCHSVVKGCLTLILVKSGKELGHFWLWASAKKKCPQSVTLLWRIKLLTQVNFTQMFIFRDFKDTWYLHHENDSKWDVCPPFLL